MVPGLLKFELVYCVNYNGILSYGNDPNLYKLMPAKYPAFVMLYLYVKYDPAVFSINPFLKQYSAKTVGAIISNSSGYDSNG